MIEMTKQMFDLYILVVIGIILIVLIISIISTYNNLVKSYKDVEKSKSLVDVYLKKRFDLIPNLVECVKEYAKYEKELLSEITNLRNSFSNNANENDANKLNEHYQKLIALIESYPEIKAGENFLKLQNELSDVEDEISASRRIYSSAITKYNTKIQVFPTNLFAKIFGYKNVEPLKFEVEDVKIKF